MRSSAVLALAILATAGPVLSAPIVPPVTSSQSAPTDDTSDALSLKLIGSILSRSEDPQARELGEILARQDVDESGALKFPSLSSIAGVASIGSALAGLFGGNNNQQREFMELLARQEVDESGALKLPSLSSIAGVASIGSALAGLAGSLFGGNNNQQREFIELLSRQEVDESGALKFPSLSSIAGAASIGSALAGLAGSLFGGNTNQQREFMELLARQDVDASEALKLPSLGTLGSIASIGLSGLGILGSLFPGSNNQQQRELLELFARQEVDESGAVKLPSLGSVANIASIGSSLTSIVNGIISDVKGNQARELILRQEVDESGAVKLPSLENVANIASIGSSLTNIVNGIVSHFTNNKRAQEEFLELLAREDLGESGALDLNSILSKISGIIGGILRRSDDPQARELVELIARQDVDESGALKIPSLSSIAGVASIGSALAGLAGSLFGGNNNQQREFMELLARQEVDESGALKFPSLSSIAGVASIGSALAGLAGSLFGGNSNQQREFMELLARQDVDASEALKLPSLGTLGSIASIGLSGLGILGSLFPGSNNQQQRELLELFARQEVDESGAVKLPSLENVANIASIGSSLSNIVNGIISDVKGRELLERQDVDASEALKLPSLGTLGSIASIGLSGLGILGSLLPSSNNQQQRRELIELLARQDVDASEALKLPSLGTLGNIASIGLSGLGILGSLLPSGNQQQQRDELVELLARSVYGRSINDLD
ncbi:hypothetical protein BDY19DRAFT_903175 [Irpex rosettiformis]|uniref:Uncharacterized protein n=1 Tax=Irpex rosettiformis TaxID=378272 RepID=A0ACB8UGF9_9APHY|nr:hypothetical protein BDY19DRAFT_903175 [Irpex rosettiformis]